MKKSIWKVYQLSTKRLVFIGNSAMDVADYLHVSESWVRNMASDKFQTRYGTKSRQNTSCLKYHYKIVSEPIRQTEEERREYLREWQKKRYYKNKYKEFMEVLEKCM